MSTTIEKFLKRRRVATIDELCTATGKGQAVLRKIFCEFDYLTSYDQNARFYTLRSLCRFNRHGIWKHERASFTQHGTLKALLIALIEKSHSGYTRSDLSTITGVSVAETLRGLVKKEEVVRILQQRRYVYFNARSKRVRTSQVRTRFGNIKLLDDIEEDVPASKLKKDIVILLEIIRSSPKTIRNLSDNLRKTHPEIAKGMINDVCKQYGIRLKKKIDKHQVFEIAVKLSKRIEKTIGEKYVFHFTPDQPYCPTCGEPTEYFKTTTKRFVCTIRFGNIPFRESQVVCNTHRYDPENGAPLIYGSSFARSLAPAKSPVGYDVITEIGKKRFLEYRQVEEVVENLQACGIELSPSTVSRWADYFLAAVECLHNTKIQKLRILIKNNGGYLLHIDATTETKSDTVFVCVDRLLGTVLLSEKISSENTEEVKKQLLRLRRNLGNPLAIMRDMSVKLQGAVHDVFPNVPDRICHAHFLRDIGKDLLKDDHVKLGHRMTKLKINADLQRLKRELQRKLSEEKVREASMFLRGVSGIEDLPSSQVRKHEAVLALRLTIDVLDYNQDGEGLRFPFDLSRVYFFTRLNRLRLRLARYCSLQPRIMRQCSYLQQLSKIADRTMDAQLRRLVKSLRSMHREFQHLRSVIRFEVKTDSPLAQTMSIGTLPEIRAYNRTLVIYTKRLFADQKRNTLSDAQKVILKHIVKYQFNLPIPEHLAELLGKLDRTNNFEEGIFRGCKRGQRRQVGKKDISREFSLHGPYLPLMLNLRNDHYISAIIGDIKDLPLRLSELARAEIDFYREKLKENRRGKFFDDLKHMDGIEFLPGYLY